MAYLWRASKEELLDLARDLGIAVDPTDHKEEIVQQIQADEDIGEECLRAALKAVQLERKERAKKLEREERAKKEQLEREERAKKEQLEREESAKKEEREEREKIRAYELERLRLANSGDSRVSGPSPNSGAKSARDLHHLMQKYNPENSDIALYLVLFERQARRANIDESDFVHHLAALLPTDIVEILSRESEEKWGDYPYIKELLLRRFRLNPEAFRTKFMQHQRRPGSLWKDYAYELRSYLGEWLKGVEVTTFEALQDLMLADQIKRRVNAEVREHFIDDWGRLVASEELVAKLDEYEVVRRAPRKLPSVGNFREKGLEANKSGSYKKENYRAMGRKSSEPATRNGLEKTREEVRRANLFEERRLPRCYACNSPDHLRPQCPELNKRKGTAENLNNLSVPGKPEELLAPFMSTARICGKSMAVLRDTGATVDVISRNHVDPSRFLKQTVWVRQPLDLHSTCLPLARIEIEGDGFGRIVTKAAVVDSELDRGYYLLGNRTAELLERAGENAHLIGAVTRSQARTKICDTRPGSRDFISAPTLGSGSEGGDDRSTPCISSEMGSEGEKELQFPLSDPASKCMLLGERKTDIIDGQMKCPTLSEVRELFEGNANDAKRGEYAREGGVFFRISEDHRGNGRKQLMLPERLREGVKALCHESVSGHLGVTKTKDRVLRYFYWPGCFKDIETYVRTCDPCQRSGKVGEKRKAPLKIVPIITEIFSKLNVDACGPLPVTPNGNKYLITVICMSSKYPDAIPVPNISSVAVTDALLKVFSRMGFPKEVQCDQGTSFTSNLTTEFFERFGIKVTHSSVYHPQSNPVERFHRTLKRLLRVLCLESGSDWEKHLPAALFALRTVTHESVGFSPAELVHGKNLRTPETLLYEHWVEPEEENQPVTEYVFNLINRMKRCQELMVQRLEGLQEKRKTWYDRKAVKRKFRRGDLVLVLAMARPHKLAVQWHGPGTIESQISETNYIVKLPEKGQRNQIFHVNMLKPYYQRPEAINLLTDLADEGASIEREIEFPNIGSDPNIFDFEEITRESSLEERLSSEEIKQIESVLIKYLGVFSNEPGVTDLVVHDVELISNKTIRSKPYRMSPRRNEILQAEIQRMLDLRVIEIGESDYTSPMVLVEAPNKDPRPCIDYRRLNEVIRTEFFPLPNIEERVEKVAASKYITILDLAKGYWQIPLSPKAQRLAAFVTSFGTYRPLRMPFGLKNAPYFFSRLMAQILQGCEDFAVPYLDDIAVFSDGWDAHLRHLDCVLGKISQARLKIKASKCRFAQRHVKYLGHIVGDGYRTPSEVKVKAILDFPEPKTKTQLRAFLGLVGYYGHYIDQFSVIAAPLTTALKGKVRKGEILWSPECDRAFHELKTRLTKKPLLYSPNYATEFIVQTDASDSGMGVVLSQRNDAGEEHPILYLSKKFSPAEKNYSTTEKECASIVFAVRKLHYYLDGQNFTVVTDHNPLVWLRRNAGTNPRLTRWSLALQPYHFRVEHRPGRKHTNADSLSRADMK